MKLFLIIALSVSVVLSNMNLKATAGRIPTTFDALTDTGYWNFVLLLARVGFVSGFSLLMSWICYRRFGFLEFMVAQSLVYVFAIGASYFVFKEALSPNRVGAVFFILAGLLLFYLPELSKR